MHDLEFYGCSMDIFGDMDVKDVVNTLRYEIARLQAENTRLREQIDSAKKILN